MGKIYDWLCGSLSIFTFDSNLPSLVFSHLNILFSIRLFHIIFLSSLRKISHLLVTIISWIDFSSNVGDVERTSY